MEVRTLVAFSLVVVVSSVDVFHFQAYTEHEKDVVDLMEILMRPRKPERFLPESYFENFGGGRNTRLTEFNFKDCGSPGRESAKILDFQLTPDPVELPGEIGLAFKVQNVKEAMAPIKASVTLKKKIVIWIDVPCVHNEGSCTYSDICPMLTKQPCPKSFTENKIPCKCPFPAGNFTLPESQFKINVADIPSGDYSVKVELESEKTGPLACLQIELSIA